MKILQEIKNAVIYTRTAKADCYSTEPQIDICKPNKTNRRTRCYIPTSVLYCSYQNGFK